MSNQVDPSPYIPPRDQKRLTDRIGNTGEGNWISEDRVRLNDNFYGSVEGTAVGDGIINWRVADNK